MKKELKTEQIMTRVEPEIKKLIDKEADRQGRTVSGYIYHVIKEDLRAKKYI